MKHTQVWSFTENICSVDVQAYSTECLNAVTHSVTLHVFVRSVTVEHGQEVVILQVA